MSAAIRYYVHVGIAAETATQDLRGSLDNTIIRNSIKDAVRYELKSHSGHIENLIEAVKELISKNEMSFGDVARRTTDIETRLEGGVEKILTNLGSIHVTTTESLRNIIVMRTIFYIFLLGYKTGKIKPGEENINKWHSIVTLTHEMANALSIDEVKMISADNLETKYIRHMAAQIFRAIQALPQPEKPQT